jgi:hypothetical protein
MSNQSSNPGFTGVFKGVTVTNEAEFANPQGPTAHQPSSEDMRVESLAKEALAETIRDGGAFASEKSY